MGIATYSYNRSTSGGEIIRELVNATDGQGLHFANGAALLLAYASGGVFGTADFSIEFILDQDSDNSSDNEIYTSQIAGSNVLKVTNSISSNVVRISFDSTNYDIAYDMSGDYGTPTHYVLTCDRSALATLYKNGNSVGTIDISGSSAVNLGNGNTANGYLGGASGYGVIGTYYRWRTWKKLLSAAEVTACYENASVPIADQWSNCVTDLDLAFANPERSLAVRSKSGVGNATASVGTFQLSPIEQLNSKSARIGTSAATPADGDLQVSGNIGVNIAPDGSDWNANARLVHAYQNDSHGAMFKAESGSTSLIASAGNSVAYLGTIEAVPLKFFTNSSTRLTIDSAGQVGIGVAPNISGGSANNTFLSVKGKATAYGGVVELANYGTNGNGQTLGAIKYFDNTVHAAEIEVVRESANDDAKMVFKTKPTGGSLTDRLTIDSAGAVSVPDNGEFQCGAGSDLRLYHNASHSYIKNATGDLFVGGDAGIIFTNAAFSTAKFAISSTGLLTSTQAVADNLPASITIDQKRAVATGIEGSSILFKLRPGSAASTVDTARIVARMTNNSDADGQGVLALQTMGASNAAPTDRLIISSAGTTWASADGFASAYHLGADAAFAIINAGATRPGIRLYNTDTGTASQNAISFKRNTTEVGTITTTNTATAFNTSSDYRLKENVTALTGALDRLDSIPVYNFNFKADPTKTVDGFLAHEVAEFVPEAIHGEKDEMQTVVTVEAAAAVEAVEATYYEDGDELPEGKAVGDEKTPAIEAFDAVVEVTEEQPKYQGIDQSKLVPLLVAAVKELKAKVTALENA
tara:strand:+ start:328 stop:2757 length:2430 start_codon:yes stop_codon:yes gene_type:complete